MLLLDTHVLVWLDEGSQRLGHNSLEVIDDALAKNELYVSAISFWEIAMLCEKQRLELKMELGKWRIELLQSGLQEVPVSGNIAICAGELAGFHGDPADRIIVATTLENSATVITADFRILGWNGPVYKIDART